ncbi:MAG: acetyl-CoA carboxylase carboxyltransferase subunit beta [Armatimonadetes bacterium]|nr:acetyl-CoA carboxylase carboxyltransferase subunit beta [Armatimonadota bacterium]
MRFFRGDGQARPKYAVRKEKPVSHIPDNLWTKCSHCGDILYTKEFVENFKVCSKCGAHEKLSAWERLELLADPGTFEEWDAGLSPADPLQFGEDYLNRVRSDQKRTGLCEAALSGSGRILGHPVALAIMDFAFRGGSMGSVVGEKITRTIEGARDRNLPLLVVAVSGGARMQEGAFSLMQMAKTSAAIARFKEAGHFYISVLSDPTTAGVAASFASLADVILAEPGALIGFTGPWVIEQTIRQKLPPGFQTAEFLLSHGFIDKVIPRKALKGTIGKLLEYASLGKEQVWSER